MVFTTKSLGYRPLEASYSVNFVVNTELMEDLSIN